MKKITTLIIAFALFSLTSQAQNNRPTATYQVGKAKVSVWENKKEGKYGAYTEKNFKIEKVYKDGDQWKSTSYFDLTELLQLKAAIDKAIIEQAVKTKEDEED